MMEAPSVTEVMKPPVEEAGVVEEKVDVRLSIEWEEEDKDAIDFIKKKIDEGIRREYAQVFAEEEHILQKVRIPNPPGSVPGSTSPKPCAASDQNTISSARPEQSPSRR